MKSKSINEGVEQTFVLIVDQGEGAFKSITDFAEREKITGASVSANRLVRSHCQEKTLM